MKKSGVPTLVLIVGLIALAAALAAASTDASALPPPSNSALIEQLRQVTGGRVRISFVGQSDRVRFVGTDLSHPIPLVGGDVPRAAEAATRAFMRQYGTLFGVTDQARQLEVTETKAVAGGRTFVRFRQLHQGLPVVGAELVVQLDGAGGVISANGEFSPIEGLSTTPALDAAAAQASAIAALAKSYGIAESQWSASPPQLQIYNPALLKPGRNHNGLVWSTELTASRRGDIRELVLVDAQLGVVAERLPQIHTAMNRVIYDNANLDSAGLPGTGPVRAEGDPASTVPEVNNAYDFLGDTYDFFALYHGRDSLDDAGMTMTATVRFCDPSAACPYPNAYWNGTQMVFGDGYASGDDVVGHELTHGVTEFESHLFYAYQSGAINEAFSDIWGEWIDLTNGAGDDSASVRWLMGEDLPIGAIRSMSDPTIYGDPDRITSANYRCSEFTGPGDWGGVHTNSGVANKAAYLLTDGATFNGYTISGLGITKTAKIFYEVQTNLFTSAGDYQDLHDTLFQGCTNLIGSSGITAADCAEVREATLATEMDVVACAADDPPMCPAGQAPGTYFFADDLEAAGSWSSSALAGSNTWYYPPQPASNPFGFDAEWAINGSRNFWGYDTEASNSDYVMGMNADAAIPSGSSPYLYFSHAHMFEQTSTPTRNWDGGVLEYSANSGGSWADAGPLFLENGYNGTIYSGATTANPLEGRSGFIHESAGYQSSRLDLSSLAGGDARFRFRIGVDSTGWDYGWFIDGVYLYHCGDVDYSNASHASYGASGHGEPLTGFTAWLGTEVGTESAPAADTNDGVTRGDGPWVAGLGASVDVAVSGAGGYLAGWFDWNADGAFSAAEQAVGQSVAAGTQTINFTVGAAFDPAANPALSARFRLYESAPPWTMTPLAPAGTAAPAGFVPGGEVEDYSWIFSPTAITLDSVGAQAGAGWTGWAGALFGGLVIATAAAWRRRSRRA